MTPLIRRQDFDAAKDGFHAGQQFVNTERLGQVVVGAGLQTDNSVHFRRLCGQHEYWHVGKVGTQLPANIQAINSRQHKVQDDELKLPGHGSQQALLAVQLQLYGVTQIAEMQRNEIAYVRVIFDDQNISKHGAFTVHC